MPTTEAPAKRQTLLDITSDMQALDDLLAEVDGDISDPEVEAYVMQLFEQQGEAFDGKVDNYCSLIRTKELLVAARKEEAERLIARARTEERDAKWLKDRLHWVMHERGLKKAGKVRTASVCGNGGKQPVDVGCDTSDLPAKYTTAKVQLNGADLRRIADALPPELQNLLNGVQIDADVDAIRDGLVKGEEIGGCMLLDRGTHLRIK